MRRSRRPAAAIVAAAFLFIGCSGGAPVLSPSVAPSPDAPASQAPTASPDPVAGKTVRVAYTSESVLLGDFVTKQAWDALAARGLNVEYQFVADDTLGVQAVIRGAADLTGSTPPSIINAHEQNPKLQALIQHNTQGWSLASLPSITTVEQLAGKRIAVHSETSFTKTVADLIIKEYKLPDVEVVIIPGSEVRAQALISGQIDATILDIQDVALAAKEAPGKVNLLVSFAEIYPALTSIRFAGSKDWIDADPALMHEIVKVFVEAGRAANDDPEATVQAAIANYPDQDPEVVRAIVEAYINGGHWIVNGGMTPENGLQELQFFHDAGQTTLEPTPANVSALYRIDILDGVLKEIGTR